MGKYDDLVAIVGSGTAIDRLIPLSPNEVRRIEEQVDGLPGDYTSFLQEVGSGEIGNAAYMLYDGLIEPEEVFGNSWGLGEILLFGDDLQGVNAGFDITNWSVIEVDSASMQIVVVAPDFQSFIRERISSLS